MKYWNKHPKTRELHWTRVVLPVEQGAPNFGGLVRSPYYGWVQSSSFDRFTTMLQKHPGRGKFYVNIMSKEVWFEQESDATWFILTIL